jgi:uncharacterized protein YndB with AHSA1/START domain
MNAVANVSTLKLSREIAAPATELFDAWLDPAKLAIWMRPSDVRRSKARVNARLGGEFEVVMQTPSGKIPHTGAYVVIDRPRRLAFTWNSPAAGNQDSLVKLDFVPKAHSTEIVLTHEKLPSEDEVAGHRSGWTDILEHVAHYYSETRAAG